MTKSKPTYRLISICIILAFVFACPTQVFALGSNTAKAPAATVKVKSVSLNHTARTLKKGFTLTLKETIRPRNASNKKVSWKSSKNGVATVTSKGTVKGIKNGTSTITCTTKSGKKKAFCKITVVTPVTKVMLNTKSETIKVGGSTTLKATVSPKEASNKAVTWGSNRTSVATVNVTGKVTAVAPGEAIITARAKDGSGKNTSCKVTVTAVAVTGVALTPQSATMAVGETASLAITISPANATNPAVSFSSSAPGTSSVDSQGVVTALASGKALITATAEDGGKKATASITVEQPISNLSVHVTAPVPGAAPQAEIAETDGYSGKITWQGDPVSFAQNTLYTATITLTAKSGFRFASATGANVPEAQTTTVWAGQIRN